MKKLLTTFCIKAGARSSPLAKSQVLEVEKEIQRFFPHVKFFAEWIETSGDKDLNTSLREMEKTDFFTKEIDRAVLSSHLRIGIHSAKDLPEPLCSGLSTVAITQGIDPSDSLVLREKETLDKLREGALIATSSIRREEMVKALRKDLTFVDIRGNIEMRLAKLANFQVDGVVIAEAALIRLGLTHLNRIKLPGKTHEAQGKLAIVAKRRDFIMQSLFSKIDSRKKVLYLGLKAPADTTECKYLHFPVIKICPRKLKKDDINCLLKSLAKATHIVFTSQTTCAQFVNILKDFKPLENKTILAIGRKTANSLKNLKVSVDIVPENETLEGVIAELKKCHPKCIFWPHSELSRPLLKNFCQSAGIFFEEMLLYTTHLQKPGPLPPTTSYDEIHFTSPSTVDGFLAAFTFFPKGKRLTAIGAVTSSYLEECRKEILADTKTP